MDKPLKKILIVGLGNPGHLGQNHNIGADILRIILERWKEKYPLKKIKSNLFLWKNHEKEIYFYLCPDTMNISGQKVLKVLKMYKCNELIICTDDLDTPKNKIKVLKNIAHRGQNGVRNIIDHLKRNQGHKNIQGILQKGFYRILIGIGRPESKKQVSSYVLQPTKGILYQPLSLLVFKSLLELFK